MDPLSPFPVMKRGGLEEGKRSIKSISDIFGYPG